jgi:hypothetical protein
MSLHMRHPSDETLLRAVDGELSPQQRTWLERHLGNCEACRARLQDMESAVEDIASAYRDEDVRQPSCPDALRARLDARLLKLSAECDRSWRFRVAERFAALPSAALVAAALAFAMIVVRALGPQPEPAEPGPPVASIESATLPIRSLTPGATASASVDELCAGHTRATPEISTPVRQAILRDYRMEDVPPQEYELDYLITPELGGATDPRNLWPERYGSSVWNARVKDDLERLLPQLVCQGTLDLATAQHDLAADWIAAYKKYFHSDRPVHTRASRLVDRDDDSAAPRRIAFVSPKPSS